jgi:hypothetical protein
MKTPEELKEDFKRLEEKLDETLAFYKKLQEKPLPDVIEVGDYTSQRIGDLMELTDAETMGIWNKRAINIQSVNKVLSDFEMEVSKTLLRGSGAILANEFVGLLWILKTITTNLGAITIIVYDVAKLLVQSGIKFIEYVGDEAVDYIINGNAARDYLMFILDPVGSTKRAAERAKRLAEAGSEKVAALVVFLVSVLVLGFMYEKILKLLDAVSEFNYYRAVQPLVAVRKRAIDGMQSRAFPQGKGRVRRRKRTRIATA